MTTFFQFLLTGLMIGGVYALIALGFVLIYKSTSIFNLAHGEILMLGAYICWALLVQLQIPIAIGIMLSLLLAAFIGLTLERLCLRPMIGQPILSAIMMTIALSSVLGGIVMLVWGGGKEMVVYPPFIPDRAFHLGGLIVSEQHLYCFGTAMLLFVILSLFFKYTEVGLGMRVVAEDHQVAQSSGVNVKITFSYVWAIACVVLGIGGILLGSLHGISIHLSPMGLKVLPVVILGGLESIGGAIVGGLIMGALEIIAAGYLDPMVGGGLRDVFPFVVMVLVLLVRPFGLFGLKRIERI